MTPTIIAKSIAKHAIHACHTRHTLNVSSGPSKFLFFRDGAEEILTLLVTAYRLAHLSLSPAQETQVGALLAALQAQLQFTNNAPFHTVCLIQCVQLRVQVRCIWSQLHVTRLICKTLLPGS